MTSRSEVSSRRPRVRLADMNELGDLDRRSIDGETAAAYWMVWRYRFWPAGSWGVRGPLARWHRRHRHRMVAATRPPRCATPRSLEHSEDLNRMGRRWRTLESDWEWYPHEVPADRYPPPELDVDDRPVAGRILGPNGETLKVVRHGPERPPFGFTKRPPTCS